MRSRTLRPTANLASDHYRYEYDTSFWRNNLRVIITAMYFVVRASYNESAVRPCIRNFLPLLTALVLNLPVPTQPYVELGHPFEASYPSDIILHVLPQKRLCRLVFGSPNASVFFVQALQTAIYSWIPLFCSVTTLKPLPRETKNLPDQSLSATASTRKMSDVRVHPKRWSRV